MHRKNVSSAAGRTTQSDAPPPFPAPERRTDIVGHQDVIRQMRKWLDNGCLSNGLMLVGPQGVGKATLAFQVARAFLAPDALLTIDDLSTDKDHQTVQQLAHLGHPDFFLATRHWNEKTGKLAQDITVDTIRQIGDFLSLTSITGRRVIIIDYADDLNKNAANAFLKSLEEPPAGTLLLLLVNAPGRILPTVRSRCRRVDMARVGDDEIRDFLTRETKLSAAECANLAQMSEGRPGYALRLADEGGMTAHRLADAFLHAASPDANKNFLPVAQELGEQSADGLWRYFILFVLQRLAQAARALALEKPQETDPVLAVCTVPAILAGWDAITQLSMRAQALNLDKTQIVLEMGGELRRALAKV